MQHDSSDRICRCRLIVIGAFFLFVGSFGLAKLTDTMRRLHAPTKATTLGIGALLIASMLYFALCRSAASELMISLFLFLTAPVTANMVAKAHIFRTRKCRSTCRLRTKAPAGRR